MKLGHFFTFIMFIISCLTTYAQSECDCEELLTLNQNQLLDSIQFNQTIKFLKKSDKTNCEFEALTLEFKSYIAKGQLDKALSVLYKQEDLLETLKCVDYFQYLLFNNKLSYYKEIDNLENLSNYAFKALSLAEKLEDSFKEIEAIQHIVFVFTRLNEDKKNWNYIQRVQKIVESIGDNKESIKYYRWLALEYETKYTLTERKTLIDTALIFINKAKKTALRYKMNDELSEAYKVLEACAYHRKEFDNAVTYIDSSIHYAKASKPTKNLGPLYVYKSWDLLELKKFPEVERCLDSAIKYDRSVGGAKVAFYHEVSSIYEGIGQIDKAFPNYKKYAKLKDSIININTLEKVNDMEQKYNKVTNENKIVQLEKTKQYYSFLVIGSLLALLILFLFFRQRSLRNKQKIMLTEQRLNKARMNPHFLFNSMASLQNLSLKENSPNTTLFISRLAKIMRQSLENTYEDLITLGNEIDFLKQYLEVQKLRYPNKFDYNIIVDDALDVNELKIPSMVIQPFVENSIEHGFKNIDYKGLLSLGFNDKDEIIEISIKDNGIGAGTDKTEKEYKSRAMQIIRDRLYLLNVQHKTNGKYNVKSLDGQSGFEIEISLPKLYDL